jgi:histidinol dehydrogenase
MNVSRRRWDGADPAPLAASLRNEVPSPGAIAASVGAIVERVRAEGDAAVLELGARFEGVMARTLRVPAEAAAEALASVDRELVSALEVAAENIEAVADAQLGSGRTVVEPGQGQRVTIAEIPVGAAGIYVPGGRAPYPSTVLMGAIPARCAGVERVVVATPAGADGVPGAAVLAACAIAGVDEIYAMGGAQAIAALALGTRSVEPVDVIAGPGGPWVQEAKLAVSRWTGIDGYAGPSELVVVADADAPPEWLALDLCAQAEHGSDGLLVGICVGDGVAGRLEAELDRLAGSQPTVGDAAVTLVEAPDLESAVALADALAPEHLEICCAAAGLFAEQIRRAGCVFVGPLGATAFGDYAAGSNHVLPTGGAGRFTGPLGPGTFRRRISVVEMDTASAVELGPIVDRIAKSEGFDVHGASARARGRGPESREDG